jgi:transcriptional regulator with XRE-family HTH domain
MNKSRLLLALGEVVRTERQKKGISQEELAAIGKFDRTYISLVERGKRNPSFINLYKLAQALDVTIGKLTEKI